MNDESGHGPDLKKRAYKKPALRVYGRVRDLTGGTGQTKNGDHTLMMTSDRRLKSNFVRVGDHPLGIGLYLFDYTDDPRPHGALGRQFGVMADEVEVVMPAAVSVGPNGYKRVDYEMLGISRPAR